MEESFIVPAEMVEEAETVVKLLKEAAKSQGLGDQVYLLRPKSKGFGPAELAGTVLLIGGASTTWLTKKWIDTYFWPLVVQPRIDAPSRKFINWLNEKLARGPSPDKTDGESDESR